MLYCGSRIRAFFISQNLSGSSWWWEKAYKSICSCVIAVPEGLPMVFCKQEGDQNLEKKKKNIRTISRPKVALEYLSCLQQCLKPDVRERGVFLLNTFLVSSVLQFSNFLGLWMQYPLVDSSSLHLCNPFVKPCKLSMHTVTAPLHGIPKLSTHSVQRYVLFCSVFLTPFSVSLFPF